MRKFVAVFLFSLFIALSFSNAFADKKLDEQLVYYITIGRLEDVQSLLEKGANPNAKDKIGLTVLSLACERVDREGFEVVKSLVEKGAEINVTNDPRNNPLMVSIKNNNPKVVRYFLEQGADFHVEDTDGSGTREIAMLYSGDEVQWLLDEAFNIEDGRRNEELTREAFDENLYKYSLYNCTHQYMSYFKKSKQDKIADEALYNRSLRKQLQLVSYYGNKLFADFYMKGVDVESIANSSRSKLTEDLDSFVSNEGRRYEGVGSVADMQDRCEKVAKKWNSERFVSTDKDISTLKDENNDDGMKINLERNE